MVLQCDMDFVPSTTLYPKVRDFFLPMMASVDRGAFVVRRPGSHCLYCSPVEAPVSKGAMSGSA